MPISVRSILSGIGTTVQAVDAAVRKALEEAYKRGYEEGAASVRSSVLAAVQDAAAKTNYNEQVAAQPTLLLSVSSSKVSAHRARPASRVQSGMIGKAVDEVFREHGGLSVVALHDKVRESGIPASKEGVGVHLRRNENVHYRREGRLWFPISKHAADFENAVSGANSAPDTSSDQEGDANAS